MAKKLEDYEWMCPDAFVNIYGAGEGTYLPCCMTEIWKIGEETGEKLANVKNDSFEDYYNSSLMKKFREAFKKNDKKFLNKTCATCINSEKSGLQSLRTTNLQKYYDEWKHKKEELEKIIENDSLPTFIQSPTFSALGQGQCNLKCGMCDDYISSARKRESIELGEISKNYPTSIIKHGEKFYRDLDWMLENCLEFELPMAEPLMVKYSYEIIKKLGKNKKLKVVTNGTINVDKFIDHVKDFKHVEVNVSIEGGEKVNTYIRYPSKWKTIIENFDKLSNLKNSNVSFISTINALNIGKFTQLKRDIGDRPWNQGSIIMNNNPWKISSIPDDVKEIYLNDLYEFGNKNIINFLENRVYDEKNMIELMKHCKRRDKLRKAYLPDVFPEWTKYYENCSG